MVLVEECLDDPVTSSILSVTESGLDLPLHPHIVHPKFGSGGRFDISIEHSLRRRKTLIMLLASRRLRVDLKAL
jgi:hypothetical protein